MWKKIDAGHDEKRSLSTLGGRLTKRPRWERDLDNDQLSSDGPGRDSARPDRAAADW